MDLGSDLPAALTRTRWVWSQPGSHGSPPPPAESRCCGSVRPISVPGAQAIAREPPTPACHQIKWISNWVEAPRPARPGWGDSLHCSIQLLFVICFLLLFFSPSFYLQWRPSSSISPCLTLGPLMVQLDPLRLEISFLLRAKIPTGLFTKSSPSWQLWLRMDLQLGRRAREKTLAS